jgi:hypothetical protein
VINVRALAEQDLAQVLEGEFSVPCVLITPEGEKIDTDTDGNPLRCRALWSQVRTNSAGGSYTVPDPLVELRRSSLSRVPEEGENWAVIIPSGPEAGAPLETFLLDPLSRPLGGGRNLGAIKLPLIKGKQSDPEPEEPAP